MMESFIRPHLLMISSGPAVNIKKGSIMPGWQTMYGIAPLYRVTYYILLQQF